MIPVKLRHDNYHVLEEKMELIVEISGLHQFRLIQNFDFFAGKFND
ncbi:MAG: hypothetical protein RL222_770, partial [Bacteroidota bacterium]